MAARVVASNAMWANEMYSDLHYARRHWNVICESKMISLVQAGGFACISPWATLRAHCNMTHTLTQCNVFIESLIHSLTWLCNVYNVDSTVSRFHHHREASEKFLSPLIELCNSLCLIVQSLGASRQFFYPACLRWTDDVYGLVKETSFPSLHPSVDEDVNQVSPSCLKYPMKMRAGK